MSVLETAETLDGYRAACATNPYNPAAREGQIYELETISPTALFYLQGAIEAVPYVRPCQFAILDSSADQGFPHTRPPATICIPASMCKESRASPDFVEMLRHEGIHIHQRKYPAEWLTALRRIGWTPVPADTIPPEFRSRLRINPDTMITPFWAWKRFHVPLPLFKLDPLPTSLHDATVQWMDLRSGALFRAPPSSFTQTYGERIQQPEHPYEIYAELLSKRTDLDTDQAILDFLTTL